MKDFPKHYDHLVRLMRRLGAGPSVVYGCEAMEALQQFQSQSAEATLSTAI